MLYTSNLVSCCTVIFRYLRFNDDLGVKLARDDKIRGLIETLNTSRTFGLAEAYSSLGQDIFDG
ncbi:MAG: hypothetical protein BWY09_01347 [Candidatus Hydrogenedentes bacterium ADurb.Bin179]|nr:MAG: hypothetical protein BWY09_01347 [Candidatus Hydrogenedentes bacterium ADurb.Bin179]